MKYSIANIVKILEEDTATLWKIYNMQKDRGEQTSRTIGEITAVSRAIMLLTDWDYFKEMASIYFPEEQQRS